MSLIINAAAAAIVEYGLHEERVRRIPRRPGDPPAG